MHVCSLGSIGRCLGVRCDTQWIPIAICTRARAIFHFRSLYFSFSTLLFFCLRLDSLRFVHFSSFFFSFDSAFFVLRPHLFRMCDVYETCDCNAIMNKIQHIRLRMLSVQNDECEFLVRNYASFCHKLHRVRHMNHRPVECKHRRTQNE